MGKFFGTDGIRGVANRDLTCELAFKTGQAAAIVLSRECKHRAKIYIGKDTRISSDMLENALAAGISSVGAEVGLLGFIPTPAV
ncbi:MAG: phosphoglucosamine mutase, partial [Clostridia bacterium]